MTFSRQATTPAISRCLPFSVFGVLRLFGLSCVLFVLAMIFAPTPAEAHGLHATAVVSVPMGDVSDPASGMTGDVDQCETRCCSQATCASALPMSSDQPRERIALDARYGRPADEHAEARPQTALKRPPRG